MNVTIQTQAGETLEALRDSFRILADMQSQVAAAFKDVPVRDYKDPAMNRLIELGRAITLARTYFQGHVEKPMQAFAQSQAAGGYTAGREGVELRGQLQTLHRLMKEITLKAGTGLGASLGALSSVEGGLGDPYGDKGLVDEDPLHQALGKLGTMGAMTMADEAAMVNALVQRLPATLVGKFG